MLVSLSFNNSTSIHIIVINSGHKKNHPIINIIWLIMKDEVCKGRAVNKGHNPQHLLQLSTCM